MIVKTAKYLIRRAEERAGVQFDYVHKIAETDIGLLSRYNRIFGFLDPNRNVPALAYHTARITGALSADCGTCVQAEINLARNAGLKKDIIAKLLRSELDGFPPEIVATATLAQSVVHDRVDDPEARKIILDTLDEKGLIEISFAMSGVAPLAATRILCGGNLAASASEIANAPRASSSITYFT